MAPIRAPGLLGAVLLFARASLGGAEPLRVAPLPEAALDVAWLRPPQLVVLFARAVALYRWEGATPTMVSRADLPCHDRVVRRPGGLLVASEAESSLWAMTSLTPRAVLFAVEADRLLAREQAEAVPWPESRGGLRFRPDTNLLEGEIAGLLPGPFLDVAHGDGVPLAVASDGRLLTAASDAAAQDHQRVGSALAPLWPGWLLAASPSAPGEPDALLALARDRGIPTSATSMPGPVRALAVYLRADHAQVLAAVDGTGGAQLVRLDLERPGP